MNQEIVPVELTVRNPVCAEGYIADREVEEVLAVCLFKPGHGDVGLRIQVLRNSAGDAVQLHAIQRAARHAFRQKTEEIADTAGGLQNVAAPETHLLHRRVDRPDHSRRGIVGVQGGCPGHLILFRGKEASQLSELF